MFLLGRLGGLELHEGAGLFDRGRILRGGWIVGGRMLGQRLVQCEKSFTLVIIEDIVLGIL